MTNTSYALMFASSLLFSISVSCATSPTGRSLASDPPVAATSTAPVAPFVTDMTQLTFAGHRAGEGYFSVDGQKMIFQSEREKGNPFYQIYLMDLLTGKSHRVSPGYGKTSCSWLSADGQHVLFASTHGDSKWREKAQAELENRKSPKSKYAWNFDETYDIYQSDLNGHHLKNLTHSPGYDAEGSYSPDGKLIAFASNRSAYLEPMSEDDQKLFARDPSYKMEIYIMNADGTHVRQLTHTPGYDGGPFFSPDGQRLTFRRFAVDGGTAEVYTMNIDGSDQRQITHLKAMSWAPFYHPSGDYLIFTTNKLGYQNFELYIVDVDGHHDPVRVTDLPGFDGLPVFTPDGTELVWTHANEKGEAQLYRAQWNDVLARQALVLPPAALHMPGIATQLKPEHLHNWVEYLASPRLEGRATGSRQEDQYQAVVATAFAKLGLRPLSGQKDFRPAFAFTAGIDLHGENKLSLLINGVSSTPVVEEDWTPLSFSQTGSTSTAPLVFAGYGLVAPADNGRAAYDSYAGIDVKGKWVVVFNGLPEDVGADRRVQLHTFSLPQHKAMMARQRGAVGLVLVDDSQTPPSQLKLKFEGRGEDAGLPVVRVSLKIADLIFQAEGGSREEWTRLLAKGEVRNQVFHHTQLGADIGLEVRRETAHNVIGELNVAHATSTVIVGAHGDHLGHGERGNSLNHGAAGRVHPGADDNASGVAGVLAVAHDLIDQVRNHGLVLKQNVVFAIWSGEEMGTLGSSDFTRQQLAALHASSYLNMDMIGRLRDRLIVQGVASASEWPALIEQNNVLHALPLRLQEDPYLPTDALPFYLKKIPVLSLFTGSHTEYHTPEDTADRLNYSGLLHVAQWMEGMTQTLASSALPLATYAHVESNHSSGGGAGGFHLYLGTIPDYSQEGQNGVLISGTSKDSPAEKAGMKAGDIIISLGGMKVQNLYDFVYCLQALKAGEKTSLRVRRAGAELDLSVTPVLKNQ